MILRDRDFGGRKPKQLLEILLLQEGRFLAKEQLADLLWGDTPPSNFMSTVEHYVSVVRKRLQPTGRTADSILVTGHGGYRIDVDRAEVDTLAFDRIADSPCHDLATIDAALALVGGELLEDEPYTEWALKARTFYGQRHQRMLLVGAEAALTAHNPTRAGELAGLAVGVDPLLEAAYRLLMTAQYMAGNQREAAMTFRTCQRVLADEAELSPMAETLALHQAILDRTPLDVLLPAGDRRRSGRFTDLPATLTPAADEPVPPVSPQRARPPVAGDTPATPFIGRVAELDQLLALCGPPAGPAQSLVTVLIDGETGVGKTRLLEETSTRLTGVTVLRLRCTPLEANLRGALLTDLVRALAGAPAARQLTDDSVEAPDWTGTGSQPSVVLALSRLLRGSEPFVVLIDDAQWADEDSIAMLASAARRSAPERGGALVLAYRTEALPPNSALTRVEPTARLTLRPLTPCDLAPFGGEALFARTGGLPLYLANRLAGGPDAELVVSAALRAGVLGQARCFGDDMFRIATIAAGVPQPYGPEEIARLLGRDSLEVADQLERLLDMGIARIHGRGFTFRYDVVREILWDTVSPARRRVLAGRVRGAYAVSDRRTGSGSWLGARDRRSGIADRRRTGAATQLAAVAGLWPTAESA